MSLTPEERDKARTATLNRLRQLRQARDAYRAASDRALDDAINLDTRADLCDDWIDVALDRLNALEEV